MPEEELFSGGEFQAENPQGVSAVLTINGATRAMDRFFGNLPAGYGTPINPRNAHVTVLESPETKIDIFSNRDLIALRNTGDQIAHHLSALAVSREVLQPSGDELKKYGRWLAIPLRQTNFMEDLRGTIADITEEHLGVKVDNKYDPHMSVAFTVKGKSRAKEHVPPFPSNLHINGYSVGRKSFRHNPGRLRSNQSYVNKSKAERRA